LSYKDNSEEKSLVSKATDYKSTRDQQYVSNEVSALNITNTQCVDNNVINIQLPYDPDYSIKPEL